MNEDSKKFLGLLKTLDAVSLPQNLERNIINEVRLLEKKSKKQNLILLGTMSVVSFITSIPTLLYLLVTIEASGFYDYLSLVTSNGGQITTYWKEISFSIIESLPYMTIALFASLVVAFAWSVIKIVSNMEPRFKNGAILRV